MSARAARPTVMVGLIMLAFSSPSSRMASQHELGNTAPEVLTPPGRLRAERSDEAAFRALHLEMGDVIFRSGTAFESRMARMLDGDTRYSHAGVLDLSDVPHVVHVVPGSGTGNLVRREALADFLAPEAAEAYAVFRVRADYRVQARHAAAAARRFYATRLPFDALFSLTSADELYCSELVWRAYLSAGLDLLEGRADRSFTGPVIRLSSLQQSRLVSRVY